MRITDVRCYVVEGEHPPVPFRWRKGLPGSGDGTATDRRPKSAILRMDTDEGITGATKIADGEAVGGQDWLLPSFLGPVLGGAALAGGFVSVVGTMLGAALVTTIRSGLLVMGIGNFWLDLFLGLFLLVAVLIQRYRGALSMRRMRGA